MLQEWLEHRSEVLVRRSRHRLGEIERRLEILAGYLIAYLNIDEVIRIIREEDEPKQVMMARWSLTDNQAEAILNMRLRALRKLEEFEIRKEFDGLTAEKTQIEALLASDAKQWKTIALGSRRRCARIRPGRPELGKRRTTFADAPEHDDTDIHHAMVEKEPVTVVVSAKGWLRAMKGHLTDLSLLTFKEGDSLKLAFPAQTTDKILVFTTGGKFYTIGADRLPGGRGHGEPIRIIVDMDNDQDIVTAFVHDPDAQAAARLARGQWLRRAGDGSRRQHPQGQAGDERQGARRGAALRAGRRRPCRHRRRKPQDAGLPAGRDPGDGPRQGRAPAEVQGWRRPRRQDSSRSTSGLTWQDSADRTFIKSREELIEWMGDRASAGRMVPKGFPRTGKFG